MHLTAVEWGYRVFRTTECIAERGYNVALNEMKNKAFVDFVIVTKHTHRYSILLYAEWTSSSFVHFLCVLLYVCIASIQKMKYYGIHCSSMNGIGGQPAKGRAKRLDISMGLLCGRYTARANLFTVQTFQVRACAKHLREKKCYLISEKSLFSSCCRKTRWSSKEIDDVGARSQ